MARDLASIQSGILPMLSSSTSSTRKRVATCVASLAICAPEQVRNCPQMMGLQNALVLVLTSRIPCAALCDVDRVHLLKHRGG